MLRDVCYYSKRYLIAWARNRKSVVTVIAMPAMWLVFMGLAFPAKFTDDYLLFVTPGILGMTVLFNAMNGGALLNNDREFGIMNKFLALPASRESILFGNIAFSTFRGLLQSIFILLLAFALGARIPAAPELAYVLVILAVFGALFSAVAATIALVVEEHGAYSAVNGLLSMPLFFASTALMPYSSMPSWLRLVASLNPVSYAVDTARSAMIGQTVFGGTIALAVMFVIVSGIAVIIFRRATI